MNSMKLRLILMGCILTILGIILLVARRFTTAFIGIIIIGIILATVGVVLKPRTKAARAVAENKSHGQRMIVFC